MCVYVYVYTHILDMHVYADVCVYTHILDMHVYICMCVYTQACMREKDEERERV